MHFAILVGEINLIVNEMLEYWILKQYWKHLLLVCSVFGAGNSIILDIILEHKSKITNTGFPRYQDLCRIASFKDEYGNYECDCWQGCIFVPTKIGTKVECTKSNLKFDESEVVSQTLTMPDQYFLVQKYKYYLCFVPMSLSSSFNRLLLLQVEFDSSKS